MIAFSGAADGVASQILSPSRRGGVWIVLALTREPASGASRICD
jgi:hypothetical protein